MTKRLKNYLVMALLLIVGLTFFSACSSTTRVNYDLTASDTYATSIVQNIQNDPYKYSGKTLKEFLYGSCRVSRATLIKLKSLPDGILLNEKPVTVRAFLTEGDTVALRLEDRPEE